MRCAVERHSFGVIDHGVVDEALPPVTALRKFGDRVELIARNGATLVVVDGSDEKVARAQRAQLEQVLAGERSTVKELECNAPRRFFANAPLLLLALLLP